MKVFLITDTHFGVRNGSQVWFKSQMDFMTGQFLERVRKDRPDLVIHLGDVFDSRQSVNTLIAKVVRDYFIELGKLTKVYIIPGNHDYYSEQTYEFCSPDLILQGIPGVEVVTETTIVGNNVLIPWPGQKAQDITSLTKAYKGKYIFTHTDLVSGSPELVTPTFSGHIHIPYIRDNCRNLGSCFPLTFTDTNRARYYYIWDSEEDTLEKVPNERSIRFWRWKDEEVLDSKNIDRMAPQDYIELYITRSNLLRDEYKEHITGLKKIFRNLWVVPVAEVTSDQPAPTGHVDIETIISDKVPEELRGVLEEVRKRVL